MSALKISALELPTNTNLEAQHKGLRAFSEEIYKRVSTKAGGGIWTRDQLITNQLLYHWATPA